MSTCTHEHEPSCGRFYAGLLSLRVKGVYKKVINFVFPYSFIVSLHQRSIQYFAILKYLIKNNLLCTCYK